MAQWTREDLDKIVKEGKKFRGLKMHGANFDGMDLEKADFRGAAVPYATFRKTNLKMANFEGANCTCADFTDSNCHRLNLKDAQMCNAIFRPTDAFGVTVTMDCHSFMGLETLDGWWWGWLFYGLLMKPPSNEAREKLEICMGPERYMVLRAQYAQRRM
jgi:hypothetical protein